MADRSVSALITSSNLVKRSAFQGYSVTRGEIFHIQAKLVLKFNSNDVGWKNDPLSMTSYKRSITILGLSHTSFPKNHPPLLPHIERTDCARILGVHFSPSLSPTQHINRLISLCNQRLFLLSQLKHQGIGCHFSSPRTLKGHLCPSSLRWTHLCYG